MTVRQWQGRAGWQPRGTPDTAAPDRALIVLNPNSTERVTEGIADALSPLAGWGVPIRCMTLAEGPPGIESEGDIAHVAPLVAERCAALEPEALGVVIACFSDPGLHAARDAVGCPVLGIGAASYLAALGLGDRFGIVSLSPASVARHARALRAMGLAGLCAGDRAADLDVAGASDRTAFVSLRDTARALIEEDGADVVILGCAGMAHARAPLEDALGRPVIDPCQAAAAQALAQIALGRTTRSPA